MLTFGPWHGMDVVQARLAALSNLRGLDGELEATGDAIVTEAQDYPPELPNQRYVRTFKLRDSWRRMAAQRQGKSVTVNVSNPIEYGPDVMGEQQGFFFVGRWKRLRAIGEAQRGALQARARAWALRTWRGG